MGQRSSTVCRRAGVLHCRHRRPQLTRHAVWLVGLIAACGGKTEDPPARATAMAGGTMVYVDAAGKCGGLKPCFSTIQAGIDVAADGDTVAVFDGTYRLAQTPNPETDPALIIDKAITLGAHDEFVQLGETGLQKASDCPTDPSSCPLIEIEGITSTGVEIGSDGVAIENLYFRQKGVPPKTPGGRIIHLPHETSTTLYEDFLLTEVRLEGGRRGARLSGDDLSVVASVFVNNAADSILVPSVQGEANFQSNFFEADSGVAKAINFEQQYQSPKTFGRITVEDNMATGKVNFVGWDIWAADKATVSLVVNHNTLVSTESQVVALVPVGSANFDQFSAITVSDNIFQGAGGDVVYVDFAYTAAGSPAPTKGQITVSHNLCYDNAASADSTNTPDGYFGYSNDNAPPDAAISMFDVVDNLYDQDPKLTKTYALASGSPALNAASDGTNIGAWQGPRPVVEKLRPRCAPAGKRVMVKGRGLKSATQVLFGTVPGTNLEVAGKNLKVTVPPGTAGKVVDVTVVTPGARGVLFDGFRYRSKANRCKD